jgi:hypothetical protein
VIFMGSRESGKKSRPRLRNVEGTHKSPSRGRSISPHSDAIYVTEDATQLDETTRVPGPVIKIHETKQCDLDGGVYSDENEILRFCTLTTIDGREFKICGECVTFLWATRHRSNADAPA